MPTEIIAFVIAFDSSTDAGFTLQYQFYFILLLIDTNVADEIFLIIYKNKETKSKLVGFSLLY